jgi:hypothetical protein
MGDEMTGFAGFIAGMRGDPADRPGPLQRAMAATDRPEEPYDDDERQASLLARHYAPGQATDLAQRLGDTLAELAAVQEENEAARKRQERIARDHAAGRITVHDIMRMDAGEPDLAREQQLERRVRSLRKQVADASARISPPQQRLDGDGLEAAASRAHAAFAEVTRARIAELGTTRLASRPAPRPKEASRSRGGVAVRSEHCVYCTQEGLDDSTSYLIHSDPDYNLPVTTPEQAALAAQYEQDQAAGRSAYQPGAVITTEYREIARSAPVRGE